MQENQNTLEAIPYINRDISWLSFNSRVLEEAKDNSLPVYERLKFLAIYSSNLDEFYRVRVATLKSLRKLESTKLAKKIQVNPDHILEEIKETVSDQLESFGNILRNSILPELRENDIFLAYQMKDIPEGAYQAIRSFFKSNVLSYLQPVIIRDSSKIFLENRQLYLLLKLTHSSSGKLYYAYVNIPAEPLPRFFSTQVNQKNYFIFIDDVIRLNLEFIFPGYKVSEAFSIKLNRDADLHIENEYEGDLVENIRSHLKRRKIGAPSRLLYDSNMPLDMLNAIIGFSEFDEQDLFAGGRYHNLNDLVTLPNPKNPELEIKKWTPIKKSILDGSESIFTTLDKQDILLHFPYHSYDYVLRFFNEAAVDPHVTEINATFYRVASDSFIVNALISAARNQKKVHAFVEVKARFDEENNIKWAKKMEEAGVKITYSIPGLKVHAKAALVFKKDEEGNRTSYAYLGTGNFNEKTAGIYTDHGLLTTHNGLVKELKSVFNYLYNQKPIRGFSYLLVSQFNIVDRFNELIQNEMDNVKSGGKGNILIKLNNLEDTRMIDKLYEASMAGVEIILLIRGICRLVPGMKPFATNIRVFRLVDRYLEHSRIFVFHNNGKKKVFMGSADWMKRNLSDRIEIIFPVLDSPLRKEVLRYLSFQLNDNMKLRIVDSKLTNNVISRKSGAQQIRAQFNIYEWLKQLES